MSGQSKVRCARRRSTASSGNEWGEQLGTVQRGALRVRARVVSMRRSQLLRYCAQRTAKDQRTAWGRQCPAASLPSPTPCAAIATKRSRTRTRAIAAHAANAGRRSGAAGSLWSTRDIAPRTGRPASWATSIASSRARGASFTTDADAYRDEIVARARAALGPGESWTVKWQPAPR